MFHRKVAKTAKKNMKNQLYDLCADKTIPSQKTPKGYSRTARRDTTCIFSLCPENQN